MIFSGADALHDDPHAVPRRPINFLAFLAVIVPDPIGVLLVKLVCVDVRLCELSSKKSKGVV